ncbi:arylsulfatase [Lentisphaera profundi]|uniref:Arylsulfatase n=1 Tax=Lentisphaera profundi TaxID=1658616 RepID=A0ABY7VWS8_9BACT|nr:arylsulfatase [Lentisphaera profundi]WDE97724.1 arylsulfatase [Lentisphaera profundi]
MKNFFTIIVIGVLSIIATTKTWAQDKPNVIVILTDDQGYGDISAHGNPVLKTPVMDQLRSESARFSDFHVAPKCTPTRGSLMTGMDAMRNGATRVCQGRSIVRRDIKMMPQYFAESGYATGMFGKWHLGDAYPHRPRFRGFQEVLSFRAWGITSLADYWQNSYFNPMLMLNGVDTKYKGYVTDIFFDEAMKWMKKCKDSNKPFFVYLPTNTPHVPDISPDKFSAPYKGNFKGKKMPDQFYGMIANIDENLGRLEAFLKKSGLRDNTILIYLSDNGTQNKAAYEIFNAGMKDKKGSLYEGGHRVPLFVRWIDGELQHGKEISELTIVQDLLPTLVDLCGLKGDVSKLDGTSLAKLLKGDETRLADRITVTQFGEKCQKWNQTVIMKDKWRLMNNKLYDVSKDPHQDKNVYSQFPEIAQQLTAHYDSWYERTKPLWDKERYAIVGTDYQNPLTLYASDWIGGYCDNSGGLFVAKAKGYWDLIVDRDGEYEIELRRWPEESQKTFIEAQGPKGWEKKSARPITQAQLKLADFNKTIATKPEDTVAKFTLKLKAGKTKLTANLLDKDGEILCGAMYVKITRK